METETVSKEVTRRSLMFITFRLHAFIPYWASWNTAYMKSSVSLFKTVILVFVNSRNY
jgi:hypothetical protein